MKSNFDTALKAEAKKVTRRFHKHSTAESVHYIHKLMKLALATLDKFVSVALNRLTAVVSALKAEKRNLAVIVSRQAAALSAATAGPRKTREAA